MSVELPRDAEGREIPLDTECLYTHGGEKQDVLSFTYYRKKDRWEIQTDTRFINATCLYLTPLDSWEKLEEDAKKTTCDYALAPRDEDGLTTCDGCPFCESESCHAEMILDVLKRAKKLAGIEEEEQR